ncbi:TPA: cation:proton antiporter, partial [archaeon]|nr:cation:proton antiporter [Candidatus Naiadarchaeales archaeon SRR2090153.bin461]
QSQVSFLLRTLFFVYLGLAFVFPTPSLFMYALIISAIIFGLRHVAVYISSLRSPQLIEHRAIMTYMMPRGLAVAVLTQIVVSAGLPNASFLSELVVSIIIITTIIAVLGASFYNHKYKSTAMPEA